MIDHKILTEPHKQTLDIPKTATASQLIMLRAYYVLQKAPKQDKPEIDYMTIIGAIQHRGCNKLNLYKNKHK